MPLRFVISFGGLVISFVLSVKSLDYGVFQTHEIVALRLDTLPGPSALESYGVATQPDSEVT